MDEVVRRRIREERLRNGMTQTELAEAAGVSTDTISTIERGHHVPRPSTMRKLAKVLGVKVPDLYREHAVPKAQAPSSSPKHEPEAEGRREVAVEPVLLEELSGPLEAHVGSNWITLPEEGFRQWWRQGDREVVEEREQQIRAEYRFLAEQLIAHARGEPSVVLPPRPLRDLNRVLGVLFVRNMELSLFAPHEDESDGDFYARQEEGRPGREHKLVPVLSEEPAHELGERLLELAGATRL